MKKNLGMENLVANCEETSIVPSDLKINRINSSESAEWDVTPTQIDDNQKLDKILSKQEEGFTEMTRQNLFLANQNKDLQSSLENLSAELKTVTDELNEMKKERDRKAAQKLARQKRKRLPKRQPITSSIYHLILESVQGKHYTASRLRIAFCLLAITGIRVSELLPIKMNQISTLCESGWIRIDRAKRGPSSHKAILSTEGKGLLKDRKEDFDYLWRSKEEDSYVFSSESYPNRMLRRETLTKSLNTVLKQVSAKLQDKPVLKSHSFRSGYITKLWKDSNDIEFVRQAIGHAKIESTSNYVELLSEEELKTRMSEI